MTYLDQQFVKNSLLLSLTILVCWLDVTFAMAERLKHARPTVKRGSMPNELHVTLTGEIGTSSDVQLRLLQHSIPDVPVYSLGVDEGGQYVKHREELEVNPNVAYYHDRNNYAVMQVTRTAGRGDREAHYELQGDLAIEGHKYSLNPNKKFQREPSSPSEAELYTLVPQKQQQFASRDHIPVPSQVLLQVVEPAHAISPDVGDILARENVQRRQVERRNLIFINVKAVVDYLAFSRFLAIYPSEKEALRAIRLWYTFIFTAVDMVYRGIPSKSYVITVRLIEIVICTTAAASNFTVHFKLPHSTQTDAYKALDAFTISDQCLGTVLKPNDEHAMLFTGYDLVLVDKNGKITKATAGMAFKSTICNTKYSRSIIEDFGVIYEVVYFAAHELAHSLGSSHDEVGNTCKEADGFIMCSSCYANNKYNWKFSDCSIASIMNLINETLHFSSTARCLLRKLPLRNLPFVVKRFPGQKFSVHQQCQMIYGNSSYMCRPDSPSNVCGYLGCFNPKDNKCTYYSYAAMGTTCGNKKMCIERKCVSDPRAPVVDDGCVFGDARGVVYKGQTCSQLLNDLLGNCYWSEVQAPCCVSCKARQTNVHGCEYGDIRKNCKTDKCGWYFDDMACCGTCKLDWSYMIMSPYRL